MAQLNFNAATVAPNEGRPDPLPTGKYIMAITKSEMKPTKDQSGAYLELELSVLDGEFKGRKVWDRLNLQNANPTAVEIAYGTLSAICHACNVIQCQDSQQLHGIPMEVKVAFKEPSGGYDASNDVKGYKPAGTMGQAAANPAGFQQPAGTAPAQQQAPIQQPAPQQQPAQMAAAPAGQANPWEQQPAQQQQPVQQPAQQAAPVQQNAPAAAAGGNTPPWAQPQG